MTRINLARPKVREPYYVAVAGMDHAARSGRYASTCAWVAEHAYSGLTMSERFEAIANAERCWAVSKRWWARGVGLAERYLEQLRAER